jgi:cation transport ATPase
MNIVGFTAFHINDSPCLSQSDIGIAFGGSSVVCKETANLVLLNQNDRIDVAILEGKRYCDNIIK